MRKTLRHRKIRELVERQAISSQEALRVRLREEGVKVTQATLSRDLRELNIVKTATEDGSYKYTSLDSRKGSAVLRCDVSGNLVVLRTENGMAPAVAYRIDAFQTPSLLGTVAGEDTVLVVVAEGYEAEKVRRELWKRLQEA